MSAMCRPMASAGLQPKMISACLFQLVIMPVRVHGDNRIERGLDDQSRAFIGPSQIVLGLFQIINVGGCANKPKDFSGCVTQCYSSIEMPAIGPVVTLGETGLR